jgi:hypothetical protein
MRKRYALALLVLSGMGGHGGHGHGHGGGGGLPPGLDRPVYGSHAFPNRPYQEQSVFATLLGLGRTSSATREVEQKHQR